MSVPVSAASAAEAAVSGGSTSTQFPQPGFDAPLTLTMDADVDSDENSNVGPAHADHATDHEDGLNQLQSDSSTSPSPDARSESGDSETLSDDSDSGSSLSVAKTEHELVSVEDACPETPAHRLPTEMLLAIFELLDRPNDLFNCLLTCKRWARHAVASMWHRPGFSRQKNLEIICQALNAKRPFFPYSAFVRRINLSQIANTINSGTIQSLRKCRMVERLTLTNCKQVTDVGLVSLIRRNKFMTALDISGNQSITDKVITALAETCDRLQGLNISGCTSVTAESVTQVAQKCTQLKRVKLNEITSINDQVVYSLAENCPNLLEVDLQSCENVSSPAITALLKQSRAMRELRLQFVLRLTDEAFLQLPAVQLDCLRILDLTGCVELTDDGVKQVIGLAPRLRNVVLAKCRNITDASLRAIATLGKNLHFIHLGHCNQITDAGVSYLVQACTRIRYIDLGCCTLLTDDSVRLLADLPKVKRIGLVKCNQITDASINVIARNCAMRAMRPDSEGLYGASLERVHLSYCVGLTLQSIIRLLNACRRLTHLSLTAVSAFLNEDFQKLGRSPPPEFTDHQRELFCVFSGSGVSNLRDFLNNDKRFELVRYHAGIRPMSNGQMMVCDPIPQSPAAAPATANLGGVAGVDIGGAGGGGLAGHHHGQGAAATVLMGGHHVLVTPHQQLQHIPHEYQQHAHVHFPELPPTNLPQHPGQTFMSTVLQQQAPSPNPIVNANPNVNVNVNVNPNSNLAIGAAAHDDVESLSEDESSSHQLAEALMQNSEILVPPDFGSALFGGAGGGGAGGTGAFSYASVTAGAGSGSGSGSGFGPSHGPGLASMQQLQQTLPVDILPAATSGVEHLANGLQVTPQEIYNQIIHNAQMGLIPMPQTQNEMNMAYYAHRNAAQMLAGPFASGAQGSASQEFGPQGSGPQGPPNWGTGAGF
ncbi:hypothetical protein TD95_003516 [Thielaviopsis punctulata]|uniref:Uncharacterized protein n=1 Tax=Thielaviopsis punctulata TaxID=72032 RepID=A0A0F4Z6Z9_9PEZI|nr:hypothetical protein TD95_003516 [Thielaviopsis punctulata]